MASPLAIATAVVGAAYFVVALVLVAGRRRMGELRAAAWLVTLGALLPAGEDGVLALWLALATPALDPNGVAGVAHPHARAHMMGAGVWTFLLAGLVVWLAHTRLRRDGDGATWTALLVVLVVGALADVAFYLWLYPHGAPGPWTATDAGFGWEPVVASIAAWAAGLAVARPALRRSAG